MISDLQADDRAFSLLSYPYEDHVNNPPKNKCECEGETEKQAVGRVFQCKAPSIEILFLSPIVYAIKDFPVEN